MKRKIVQIDREKCTGCGLCANACHEGAIGMVDGKATLLRDDYCDGMGDCLPACPADAIRIVEREADAYDEKAVATAQAARAAATNPTPEEPKSAMQEQETTHAAPHMPPPGGCPGKMMRTFHRAPTPAPQPVAADPAAASAPSQSELVQWPVQIRLVPAKAPYFDGAKLLIAADCTAYAYAAFHRDFMRGKVTIVGCPKLEPVDYSEKLTEIIRENDIKSATIVRMEVPCCGGLELAAKKALQASGKFIPWQVVTISLDGRILE